MSFTEKEGNEGLHASPTEFSTEVIYQISNNGMMIKLIATSQNRFSEQLKVRNSSLKLVFVVIASTSFTPS